MRSLYQEEVKSLLQKYSVRPSKKAGQSFLTSHRIAKDIVSSANLTKDESVLEIGGGLGILTQRLAQCAKTVYVVEKDVRLVRALREILSGLDNVEVIEGDALEIDFPEVDKVVCNLPYSISSDITFRLLEEVKFESATLMYQKEFADHLIAQPGSRDYSRITVAREFYADAEFIMKVPKTMYHPSPKVDSMIIKLSAREPVITPRDKDHFFKIIRLIFSHKKRTVRNALLSEAGILGVSKPELREKLEGLPHADERAFKLTLEKLFRMRNKNGSCDYLGDLLNSERALRQSGKLRRSEDFDYGGVYETLADGTTKKVSS